MTQTAPRHASIPETSWNAYPPQPMMVQTRTLLDAFTERADSHE